ncbi:hypothetical protein BpHYR1_009378 [Brachionus plicatilis]|uniref:Uncharacterized protein n=1 Tax=Brachionus plicatilis TaxID=10195 RepID=A0A3M7QID7_BRAPC|nr:hypothetical protein BpHYR1_009378 [Brachionus plicatilis]
MVKIIAIEFKLNNLIPCFNLYEKNLIFCDVKILSYNELRSHKQKNFSSCISRTYQELSSHIKIKKYY